VGTRDETTTVETETITETITDTTGGKLDGGTSS
jgi:hypothetical protein